MKSILFSVAFLMSTTAFANDHPWPYPDQDHRTATQQHDYKNDHGVNHYPNHYKNHRSHHLHGDAGASNK